MRKATKSPAEREDEEAERLVRKAPEKKPPRHDRDRARVNVDDQDLENGDKDLSMNYKDIGGSVAMASFIAKIALDRAEEEFLNRTVVNPSTGNKVKIKSLRGKPQDTPEGKTYRNEYEKWRRQQKTPKDDDASDNEQEPKKDIPPETHKDAPKPKPAPTKKRQDDETALDNSSLDDLLNQSVSGDDAARKVLEKKLRPVPEDFPEVGDSQGILGKEERAKLVKQIQGWDYHTYSQNMRAMMDNMLQAKLDQKEADVAYFQAIIDVYASQERNLKPEGLAAMDMKSFLADTSESNLLWKKQKLFEHGIFSSMNNVKKAIEDIDGLDDGEHNEVLKSVLEGVSKRKQLKDDIYSDQILSNLRTMDIEPDDIDFTDPRQREDLLMQVRRLGDNELAELVSGNDYYETILGTGGGYDDGGITLSSKDREAFFETFMQDIEMKGQFEQLTFANDSGEPLVTPATLLRLEYSLRNAQGPDRKIFSSFTDFLMEFLMEASKELENRVVGSLNDRMLARKVAAHNLSIDLLQERRRSPSSNRW